MASIITQDGSQRNAGRVAGLALLLAIAIVIVANYSISFRLIVPGNATDTARNILAHETLFRINIASNLIYVVVNLVLIAALYLILKPVNRYLALAAALCRMVFAFTWGATAVNMLGALRLLGNTAYLPVFQADQLQTLARLQIATGYDAYYVGLPFWSLGSLVCSYLWLRSRYIPSALAVFGMIASAWCAFCAFAFLVFPHFTSVIDAYLFDVPMTLFELLLGFWLVFRSISLRA
jgi:hypothetical protein